MSDDGYVHDPDAVDEGGERVETPESTGGDAGDGLSNRQGWLVVALVGLCFVAVPLLVYFWPPGFLGFQDAYLAAAMVPGLVLGLVGLWAVAKGRG